MLISTNLYTQTFEEYEGGVSIKYVDNSSNIEKILIIPKSSYEGYYNKWIKPISKMKDVTIYNIHSVYIYEDLDSTETILYSEGKIEISTIWDVDRYIHYIKYTAFSKGIKIEYTIELSQLEYRTLIIDYLYP